MEVRVREQAENVVVTTDDVTGETTLWLRPGLFPTEVICELGIALQNCCQVNAPQTHFVAYEVPCVREHVNEPMVMHYDGCSDMAIPIPHLRANEIPKARQG